LSSPPSSAVEGMGHAAAPSKQVSSMDMFKIELLEGEISEESTKSSRLKYVSTVHIKSKRTSRRVNELQGRVPNLANVKRTQRAILQLYLLNNKVIYIRLDSITVSEI
jgi:hypothetical protein